MMYGVYRTTLHNPDHNGHCRVSLHLIVSIWAKSPTQALQIALEAGHPRTILVGPMVH